LQKEKAIRLAIEESNKSQCLKLKSGAVLVGPEGRVIGRGHNCVPFDSLSCDVCPAVGSHCVRAVHAEEQAIGNALSLGFRAEGSTMYCTHKPCIRCAQKIKSFGITRVVYLYDYKDNRGSQREILEGIILEQAQFQEENASR
jgi:dCMP deaminase